VVSVSAHAESAKDRWGIVRAIVLAVLLGGTLYPMSTVVPFPAVAAVLTVALTGWEILRRLPRLHPAVVFVVPVFALLAIPGYTHAPPTGYGQEKLHNLITVTLLSAAAAALLRDRRDLSMFTAVWVVAGCVVAASVMFGEFRNGRAVGVTDANPIWLARHLGSAAVAAVWLYTQKRLRLALLVPAAAFLGAALLSTGSRGPASALAIALLIVVLGQRHHRVLRLATSVVACVAFAAVVALTPLVAGSRFDGFFVDPTVGLDRSGRSRLLELTMPVIAHHPGGVGYGGWKSAAGVAVHRYPHNLWLELTAEAGWLVGAVFALLTAVVVWRLFRLTATSPHATVALGLLTFEVVCVSVSGDLNARSFFAFLTLGALVSTWWEDDRREVERPVTADPPVARVYSQPVPAQSIVHLHSLSYMD
jgi:O-Antigen ligase